MKIALLGYGKMGRIIEQLATTQGAEIVLKVDASNRADITTTDLQQADVAIEFSRPEAAVENIKLGLAAGIPVVCGTTGWLAELPQVQAAVAQQAGGFFYASNFSIGVNVFFALNKYLAQLMQRVEGYTVSLSETHHTQKLDAPSGTAITLAEGILSASSRLNQWQLKEEVWLDPMPTGHEVTELTTRLAGDSLPITSYRQKEVPGTHQITYQSMQDSIRIEHQAHSREGFALGALAAARWMIGKQGIFGMEDMLGKG
ncbi:MAG: 4-hydroxy-tetrahydrodipicolinate reductase [Bacteroidota bacterium]